MVDFRDISKPNQLELKYRMSGNPEGEQARSEDGSNLVFDDNRSSGDIDIGANLSSFFMGGAEHPHPAELAIDRNVDSRKPVNFVSAQYSPFSCHVMFFLMKRRIMVFDLCVHRPIASVTLDRTRADFIQLLLCKDSPENMFCLHSDGT